MIKALAEVCKIDLALATKTQRDQLFQSAGILYRAGAKRSQPPEQIAEAIHYVAGFFRKHDWRGKKGDTPRPKELREVWREAIEARGGSHPLTATKPNISDDAMTPAQVAARAKERRNGTP